MIYRHIYLGEMAVEPSPINMMTDAVKPVLYLVKISTPGKYQTKEEAVKDDLSYVFQVMREGIFLKGFRINELPEDFNLCNPLPARDRIMEEDWSRYRLIRMDTGRKKYSCIGEAMQPGAGYPCRKSWRELFPAIGCYPVVKKDCMIVGFPYVKGGTEDADSG